MEEISLDKPVTLSVKQWIIRNLSVKRMVSERIIEAVINHQFESAYKALDTCNSLEFSGFGKFYFNRKRADKKMLKFYSQKELFEKLLQDETLSEEKRKNAQGKLKTAINNIHILKQKLNEPE